MSARVLVASDFNAKERAHFASSYEFCQVIADCDDADLVAPPLYNYLKKYLGRMLPPNDDLNVQRDFNRLINGLRKGVGLKNGPTVVPVDIQKEYDLFVYIAWGPATLVELSRLRHWRKRCAKAVVFLHELWGSSVESYRDYLKILDQFDHVFLLHQAAIPRVQQYTSTPCSFRRQQTVFWRRPIRLLLSASLMFMRWGTARRGCISNWCR
jgi:hypothetical protein